MLWLMEILKPSIKKHFADKVLDDFDIAKDPKI